MKTPAWMLVIILICLFPVFSFPFILGAVPPGAAGDGIKTFVWIYPFYMLMSAWLAYHAYPRRSYVSWLLVLLMLLTTAMIYVLVFGLEN